MIISTRTILLAPIWGVGAMVMSIIGAAVGPDIEVRLFPVLADQVVGEHYFTPDHKLACFDWTYTKARDPDMVRQNFVIEREDGIRYPVEEWRPDIGTSSNQSTTAQRGKRRTIQECVKVPAALRGTAKFTVKGRKIYHPTLRWEIEQPLPPVTFASDDPVRPVRFPSE